MKKNIVLIFVFFAHITFSQEKYEFFGALKLNGSDKSVITYRLSITENDGRLQGFSITDVGGTHETKNSVSGEYNKKTKEISFREDDILYTKSTFSEDMFCFLNYTGKVKLSNENSKIEGDFKGLYKNKKKCIDGTVLLIGSSKLYKLLGKLNNKLQKSKKFDDKTKQKANPIHLLDSLKVNNLGKGENLTVFAKSDQIEIAIWDPKIEDGDVIQLYQNNKILLDHYEITNSKKTIKITLDKNPNVFIIEAVNEGSESPNTAEINILDGDKTFELISNLKKGEKATITIIK